jgi:CelD/BcsL family acetyltransferase involved in cellulose biosynthesis
MLVEVVRGLDGLRGLAPEWDRLVATIARPRLFHKAEWYACYLEAFEPDPDSVLFCACRDGARLVAVLPWRWTRRRELGIPLRTLDSPKYDMPLHDFVAAVDADPAAVLRATLDHVGNLPGLRWDLARMTHLLADSAAWSAVRALDPPRTVVIPAGRCDHIRCAPYDELQQGFSKNFRGNLRKARNKLNALPGVEWVHATDPPELAPAYEAFLSVEASGWKADQDALQRSPRKAAFFRRMVEHYGARGRCEISLLRLEGRTLAAQLSVVDAETLYLMKIAYDEDSRRLAPGNMLMERLLERLGRQREIRYVNLISGEPWHDDWRAASVDKFHAYVFAPTWRGHLGHLAL